MRWRPLPVPAERKRVIRGALIACALVWLGGCAAEPPRIPPSVLESISPTVTLSRVWSVSMKGGRGRFDPLVGTDAVTVADRDGVVARLARDTGKRQWRTTLDATLVSGVGGDDAAVFVSGDDGALFALDAQSGAQRWQTNATSEVLTPVSTGFGALIVRSADGRVVSLDPADGSERWSNSWTPPALTLNGYSRPLLLDGGVLLGLDDGRLLALDSGTGRAIWETALTRPSGRSEVERLADIDADVLVDQQGIYVVGFQGRVARIEPARGQVVWGVPMSSTAGIALDDDTLYVVDDESSVHALDKVSGTKRWKQESLRGRKLGAPARFGNVLLVGDLEGYVHALDIATGAIVGRTRPAKSAIRARPAGDASSIIVQSVGGRVAALRLGDPG